VKFDLVYEYQDFALLYYYIIVVLL